MGQDRIVRSMSQSGCSQDLIDQHDDSAASAPTQTRARPCHLGGQDCHLGLVGVLHCPPGRQHAAAASF